MDVIRAIERENMKDRIPKIEVGNTIRVHVRISEGNKSRIQVFEGTVIAIKGSGVNQTFTVRRISYGVGVEKTFLVHSPLMEKVELIRVGKARRAKLYYLRDRVGKKAKTKMDITARIKDEEIELKEAELIVPETEAEEEKIEIEEAKEADKEGNEIVEEKTEKEEKVEEKTEAKEDKKEENKEENKEVKGEKDAK